MNKIYYFLILTSFFGCNCEVGARSSLKIVNGTDAKDGEFPYLVQLRTIAGDIHCGGSIIAPGWILTAAHCSMIDPIDHIVYGFNQPTKSPETTIKVEKIFNHPNFIVNKNNILEYDLALLQLSKQIPLGTKAQTIQLVEPDGDIPFHVETKNAGWGRTAFYNGTPVTLQKITTQILGDEECKSVFNTECKNPITNATGIEVWDVNNNVCIENLSTSLCFGDSGSPLVVNGIQYGIASWSCYPCEVFPTAFVRISNPEYRKWIKEMTNV